jgi:outer membrane usher protein
MLLMAAGRVFVRSPETAVMRQEIRPFPSTISPVSAVVLFLFGSAGAWGATTEPGTSTQLAEVEFNDQFLQQSDGARVDISRFSKGNAALPGDYRADLYVNGAWLGRTEIQLRQIGQSGSDVQACFDRALLERIGVDLMKLPAEVAARLETGAEGCLT